MSSVSLFANPLILDRLELVLLKLVNAATDAEREEALMVAAEEIKRALDARKFGG